MGLRPKQINGGGRLYSTSTCIVWGGQDKSWVKLLLVLVQLDPEIQVLVQVQVQYSNAQHIYSTVHTCSKVLVPYFTFTIFTTVTTRVGLSTLLSLAIVIESKKVSVFSIALLLVRYWYKYCTSTRYLPEYKYCTIVLWLSCTSCRNRNTNLVCWSSLYCTVVVSELETEFSLFSILHRILYKYLSKKYTIRFRVTVARMFELVTEYRYLYLY